MQLATLTDGRKRHWLYPFRDRIKSIKINGNQITVLIHTRMDELQLDASNESLKALGITWISVDTPIEEVEDYFNPYSVTGVSIRHTGQMFIELTFNATVADNYLLTC